MKYELPKLEYDINLLEPIIGNQNIHYEKHHQTYLNKVNEAIEKYPELSELNLEDMLQSIETLPEDIRLLIRNNGGGVLNHNLFWDTLNPELATLVNEPEGTFKTTLETKYSSLDEFKEVFKNTALNRFGSGWAWLVLNANNELDIYSTANQDNPLMESDTPILGIDVWEHAYYLKFQNRRAEYFDNWWTIVDWKMVSTKFEDLTSLASL